MHAQGCVKAASISLPVDLVELEWCSPGIWLRALKQN